MSDDLRPYPTPPSFPTFAARVEPGDHEHEPPRGSLAPYCHPHRISSRTLWRSSYLCDEPEHRHAADAVRAWFIPHLVDRVIELEDSNRVDDALMRELQATMPDVAWRPIHRTARITPDMPIAKYGILHTCVPTPPDEASGDAMSLELYGVVTAVDGVHVDGVRDWLREHAYRGRFSLQARPFVDRPFTVRLERAVWANIAWTHVGVPFYL